MQYQPRQHLVWRTPPPYLLPLPPTPPFLSPLAPQNLREWATKSAALQEKARSQREEGERLLDDARERLPKVSDNVKTLRMYLESLQLARSQIELEHEFGLAALRTRQSNRGRRGAAGAQDVVGGFGGGGGGNGIGELACVGGHAGVQTTRSGCGLEVRMGGFVRNTNVSRFIQICARFFCDRLRSLLCQGWLLNFNPRNAEARPAVLYALN